MNTRADSTGPLRVLVTGATSGVGAAVAGLFAREGARVALLARRGEELQRVTAELGPDTHAVAADVADPASASAGVRQAISTLGSIDVAVNAAGIAAAAPLEVLDDELWRRVIDTNLTGTFVVSREVGVHMRAAGGGSIVNVASDLASMGMTGHAHYCASKAGVVGLTRALAVELAPTVRVNVVCPGPIDTAMMRAGLAEAPDPRLARREKEATVPLGRLADPTEVARAIRFLAVDGTFATGTSMAFDGGTSAV